MNKKIAAAVSSAALVLGSTAAHAGIIIPAGEWTLDVNGNVNVYASVTNFDNSNTVSGGLAGKQQDNEDTTQSLNTGLLPAWLGFTGTTRQNDLDVSFTISMQPNVSDNGVAGDSASNGPLWRQAFLTFGDKSWGTVKMGKDLGIFAGNAILADMTLLGVGGGASQVSGNSTSLGGIGTGYVYPSWKGQISYTSPNFNGFTATVGITNPNQHAISTVNSTFQDRFGLEGQVQYAFDSGKVWASGASYKYRNGNTSSSLEWDAEAIDIGASVNFGNLGLVAYYYDASGVGATMFGGYDGGTVNVGGDVAGVSSDGSERDSDGGYVQATYVIPSGTKLGVAYGVSNLDKANSADTSALIEENKRWTVGAYHPLTKHLNLVAEYNNIESNDHNSNNNEADTISLGAILFF
jgi:predicted porin